MNVWKRGPPRRVGEGRVCKVKEPSRRSKMELCLFPNLGTSALPAAPEGPQPGAGCPQTVCGDDLPAVILGCNCASRLPSTLFPPGQGGQSCMMKGFGGETEEELS